MRVRNWLWLGFVPALAFARALSAQQPGRVNEAALQRLLVAEDARGTGDAGLAPLMEAIRGTDTLLRRVAVRGLGRLQRPEVSRLLLPLLRDPVPAVRAEAASAVAQGLQRMRRDAPATDTLELSNRGAMTALIGALEREKVPAVIGALAEALGRLPFADSSEAREAERAMRAHAGGLPDWGIVHGLYSLALARRFTGGLSGDAIGLLRTVGTRHGVPEVRRLAVLALGLVGGLDSTTMRTVAVDRDEQVRRLSLAGAVSFAAGERAELVRRAVADPSPIVRVAAIGAIRSLARVPECSALMTLATRDPHPWVRLIAIDSLGAPCTDGAAARAILTSVIGQARTAQDDHGWQAPARAFAALARVDSGRARPFLARYAGSSRWQERVVAAAVAARLGDGAVLNSLSRDKDQNVREGAVAGLVAFRKHAADSVYIAALGAPGYQVVLAAADALAGSTAAGALPALLDAFDRVSGARSENARDPRLAMLRRIGEMGSVATVDRLRPYLADFDTTVAQTAASLVSRWSGAQVSARPMPLPIQREPLARLFLSNNVRLRVTLTGASGGGSFTIALFSAEAPATVARMVRLAQSRFYEGGILQRVEPNFVVQGGGPGATEYIGDSTFMRDELTARSHRRGTIGISTRGRDTGDAQIFINVVDNPRLDHEYTVVGVIVRGRAVSERIMDGDVIARVEVLGAP